MFWGSRSSVSIDPILQIVWETGKGNQSYLTPLNIRHISAESKSSCQNANPIQQPMKTNYFSGCASLDEVKQRYKQLALENHPDRGGDKRVMQEINAQYEAIKKNPSFKFWKEKEESRKDFTEFPSIISMIIGLEGITIELCGNWIWISGATFRYKQQLKKAGFFFAGEKKLWYWRPHDYKSANRKPIPIEEIRRKYGSDVYTPSLQKELEEKQ